MTAEEMNETIRDLRVALEESVKLQSHYAAILNAFDGGERRGFVDAQAWMDRLCECGVLPASRRPPATAGPRVVQNHLGFSKLTLTSLSGDLYEFNLRSIGVQASVDMTRTRARIVVEGPWRVAVKLPPGKGGTP